MGRKTGKIQKPLGKFRNASSCRKVQIAKIKIGCNMSQTRLWTVRPNSPTFEKTYFETIRFKKILALILFFKHSKISFKSKRGTWLSGKSRNAIVEVNSSGLNQKLFLKLHQIAVHSTADMPVVNTVMMILICSRNHDNSHLFCFSLSSSLLSSIFSVLAPCHFSFLILFVLSRTF
jgi:hypothetical protein